jgi:hypothetical protein
VYAVLGIAVVLAVLVVIERRRRTNPMPSDKQNPSAKGDDERVKFDRQPFFELSQPRAIDIDGFPEDLRRFYSQHEGYGLESSPEPIVRICKLSEVKPMTWKDLHIFGKDHPPPGWENFAAYRLGMSSFFDDIMYVRSAPSCKPGSILTIGVDVSGPGGDGPQALEYSAVLACSFDSWIEHLRKMNWTEYGLVPGGRGDLPVADQRLLIDYFKALNPRSFWKDAKPKTAANRP